MDADYQILPRRAGKSDGSYKNIKKCKYFTNYFHVEIDQKKSRIYQYSFLLPEDIPQDSSIYHEAIRNSKNYLKN